MGFSERFNPPVAFDRRAFMAHELGEDLTPDGRNIGVLKRKAQEQRELVGAHKGTQVSGTWIDYSVPTGDRDVDDVDGD